MFDEVLGICGHDTGPAVSVSMPTLYVVVTGFELQSNSNSISLPIKPCEATNDSQNSWCLATNWEARVKCLAPRFRVASPNLLRLRNCGFNISGYIRTQDKATISKVLFKRIKWGCSFVWQWSKFGDWKKNIVCKPIYMQLLFPLVVESQKDVIFFHKRKNYQSNENFSQFNLYVLYPFIRNTYFLSCLDVCSLQLKKKWRL